VNNQIKSYSTFKIVTAATAKLLFAGCKGMGGIKLHMLKPMERHIFHPNGQVADNSLLYVSITNVAATVAAIDAATLYYY
jgi:hypothetical protein